MSGRLDLLISPSTTLALLHYAMHGRAACSPNCSSFFAATDSVLALVCRFSHSLFLMPPKHAIFVDSAFKFTVGVGLGAGVLWKAWAMMGANTHYDQVQGSNNTDKANDANR